MLKVYEYKGCSTCRKALKFLDENKVEYKKIPIRETPPSKTELKKMLKTMGDIKKLFNTSGQDYRKMGLKDKWSTMSPDEIFTLLNTNGNLIKRPFVIGQNVATVGFKEDQWKKLFG